MSDLNVMKTSAEDMRIKDMSSSARYVAVHLGGGDVNIKISRSSVQRPLTQPVNRFSPKKVKTVRTENGGLFLSS